MFRQLRAQGDVPALFLSARDADADRLFGLGLGADDYLTKPFFDAGASSAGTTYSAARLSDGIAAGAAGHLQLGLRTVELADALVRMPDGTTVPLTATERALLQKLAENRGHILTYDALYEAVWGQDYYGCENSLTCTFVICGKKSRTTPATAVAGDGARHRV